MPAASDRRRDAAATAHSADAPVEVVAYDDSWPSKFEAECARLEPLLAEWLAGPIEHVGSTAVPNMPAKPVVDIMAPVNTLHESEPAIDALVAAGYTYSPYKSEQMHWFCKPSPEHRTHHLHLVPLNSIPWAERLAFRDALRANPQWAVDYAKLKRQLAEQYRHDREGYTEAKSPFIRSILWKVTEQWQGAGA